MTFMQLAQKVLEEEKAPLSPVEIWEVAKTKGYDKSVDSQGRTPWNSIGAQLYVDVRDNSESLFVKASTRPTRFGLKALAESGQLKTPDAMRTPILTRKKIDYLEKDLHPFVAYYGFHYLRAYLKTIRHNKSEKKEFGEWVHPDMVGCHFSFGDWESEVVELSSAMANVAVKLFSFELKRELNFSNLRESFFQAVSNSSWANEGYLVAADIASDEDFLDELQRLSTSFGIGIIDIDIEDPDSTEVIFPAKPRDIVDWETINKLAALNPDFAEFLKRVRNDISSKEIRKEQYDQILAKEELLKLLSK